MAQLYVSKGFQWPRFLHLTVPQNRKLSSRWVCWICVTSVVLAELSFTQLSVTAGSFDPGRAPPLHSCLCPLFIQEAPGVQTLSGTSESGLTPTRPQPHPGRSCQDGWRAAARTGGSARISLRNGCPIWVYSSQGFVVIAIPGSLGWPQALDFIIVSWPLRSPPAPAAARRLLVQRWPTSACVQVRVWQGRGSFLLTQRLFPCVWRPFSHVSGQRRPRDTLSGGLISQYKVGMLIPGSNQRVGPSSDCEHQTTEAYVKAGKLDKPETVIFWDSDFHLFTLNVCQAEVTKGHTINSHMFRSIKS